MNNRLNSRMRHGPGGAPTAAVIALLLASAGCSDQNAANEQLVAAQQRQIEQNQRDIEALQAQQQQNQSYPKTAAPPGTCDPAVAKVATTRGGQRMAAGDFSKALGYYQDALTACPLPSIIKRPRRRVIRRSRRRPTARSRGSRRPDDRPRARSQKGPKTREIRDVWLPATLMLALV